jgi:hypothetical protein
LFSAEHPNIVTFFTLKDCSHDDDKEFITLPFSPLPTTFDTVEFSTFTLPVSPPRENNIPFGIETYVSSHSAISIVPDVLKVKGDRPDDMVVGKLLMNFTVSSSTLPPPTERSENEKVFPDESVKEQEVRLIEPAEEDRRDETAAPKEGGNVRVMRENVRIPLFETPEFPDPPRSPEKINPASPVLFDVTAVLLITNLDDVVPVVVITNFFVVLVLKCLHPVSIFTQG